MTYQRRLDQVVIEAQDCIDKVLNVLQEQPDGSFVVPAKYRQEILDLKNFMECNPK